MISVERARECIGRPVAHESNPHVSGVVDAVTERDVWVRSEAGDSMLCIPEYLNWVPQVHPELADAVKNDEEYENGQVGYDPPGEDRIGVVFSSALANDDNEDHALVLVLPLTQAVVPVTPIVNPWLCSALEEALGWKNT